MPTLKSVLGFIMSQDERIESRIRQTARTRLKQNFCYLKNCILYGIDDIDQMIENLSNTSIIGSDTCQVIKRLQNSTLKVESILKNVSKSCDETCFSFLRLLSNVDLKRLLETETVIPDDRKRHFGSVTNDTLQIHINYMKDQLEMKKILDTLLEYDVITVEDHDEIQLKRRRREKAESFITCLFGKDNDDWIAGFLYVLEKEGFTKLAEELTRSRAISPNQDLSFAFGSTTRVTARLRVMESTTEHRLLEENGALVVEAVRDVFRSPLLDLRPGSLYLLLNISNDTFTSMLNDATDKLLSFIKKMLEKSNVSESINKSTVLFVELEKFDGDSSHKEIYGQDTVFKTVGPAHGNLCSKCRQQTIIENYEDILDEIETEIIEETLEGHAVSDFVHHKCIECIDSLPRTERAELFIQYVLVHEDALSSFWNIFEEKTGINLDIVQCDQCTGKAHINEENTVEEQRQYEFIIQKDIYGNISVQLSNQQPPEKEKSAKQLNYPDEKPRAEYDLEQKEIPSEILMVAAIDIGTSYSGYAFSMLGTYQNNPLEINCNQAWNSKGKQLISSKTPTCILLTEDGDFVSFGYDAESDYADIVLEGQEDDYIFVDRFKMVLHKREHVSEDILVEDVRGRTVRGIDVFSLAIKALKDHLMKNIENKIKIHQQEIKWVLTVPAMWSLKAKEFMRKSAEKAGIHSDQLLIALEPEASSVYYQSHMSYKQHDDTYEQTFNDKYMIVDLGGGTADISVHERVKQGELIELCPPEGGAYGGTIVDENFLLLLENIVGSNVMQHLTKNEPASYLDLLREFECAKRVKYPVTKKRQKTNIIFPLLTFNNICNQIHESSFIELLERSQYRGKILVVGDKIRIDKKIMDSLFTQCTEQIIRQIADVFRKVREAEVSKILLVGGFADSFVVKNKIRTAFKEKEVVVLDDSDLIVLKGAVLFGHNPDFITARISKYTYGRRIRPKFDPKKHSTEKMALDGSNRCFDVFEPIINRGESMPIGRPVTVEYHTIRDFQDSITVALYASTEDKTMYVDDPNCKYLGQFVVSIPNPSKEVRYVDVQLTFGRTELQAVAIDRKTGLKCSAELQIV